MKFRKSINFKGSYKITQKDGIDSVYLDLEELQDLKEEIERVLEVASQKVILQGIDPYDGKIKGIDPYDGKIK